MADQLARGLFARFAPTENPFDAPNDMEDNLRFIDDHLAIYTLLPPVLAGTARPLSPPDGAGQIYTDGSYAVFNAGTWATYPPLKGLKVTLADGSDYWLNTGVGWTNVIAQASVAEAGVQASLATTARVAAEAARDAALTAANVWPTTAAGIGAGVQSISALVGGSGGTNGTFALAFSGGTQVIAPVGRFVVAGGVVVSVAITYPGYYSAGTPTLSFAASSGLTGASATAVMGVNTPLGEYFSVPSAVVGEGSIVYRVTAGPAATEAFRTVAPASVTTLLPRSVPYITLPSLTSPLLQVLEITLNDGLDLSAYPRIFPRYCFRDNPGPARFQFVLSAFDGVSTNTDIIGVGASGSSIDPTGYTGQKLIPLKAINGSVFAGVANGAIVGYLRFDFRDGSDFSNVAYTWATAGLYTDKLKVAAPVRGVIADIAAAAVRSNAMLLGNSPFAPQVNDTFLCSWITSISIEGGEPGHEYIVSKVEAIYFSGIPLWRWKVVIRDLTLGIDVCEYRGQSSTNPTGTDVLEEFAHAYQGTLAAYVGIVATIGFNWAAVNWTQSELTFTTYAQAGIAPANVHSNDAMDEFLDRPNPSEVIYFGTGGAHATATAALESLHRTGLIPAGQATTLPWSNTCGYGRQVLIEGLDADHVEDVNEGLMPPYVTIRGKGMDGGLKLHHQSPDSSERLLEFRHSGRLENMTLEQRGPAYIVHSDAVNDYSKPAEAGPPVQHYRIRKVLKNCRLVQAGTGAWGWGSGISSGEYQLFDHCVFDKRVATDTTAMIGVHTSPGSALPATVHFRECVEDHGQNTGVVLLCGFEQKTINRCIVEGGNIKLVSMGCSMADGYSSMPDKARLRVAWDVFGDAPGLLSDSKMEVLKVAAGTAVSGTAAALLFGAGYDQKHGRGELLIMEENSARKLGARLGNCTSVNKTLTMGGTTHTFSNNYTGMTEAAILSEVNATFSGNPLSVVNLAPFIVLGSMRRVYMQAAADIAAKRFVTIANGKCSVTSGRPDGFTMEAMVTDGSDTVILDRQFAAALIPELVTPVVVEGEFGLTSGVADTAATPKVGMVHKGLVTLY